ncbi:MAG: hypothetical protein ACFE8C_09510 [Promethearchaeota archaeon]
MIVAFGIFNTSDFLINSKVIEEQLPGPGGGTPSTGDDDDDDEDEGIDIAISVVIGVGVISAIGTAGIAIYLLKRKR